MCSNPSGVHTRPVGESEKTSSSVVVVYRSPQCIYLSLSLSGIYQYSKWTLHKGYHAIHYTPQLETISKKTKIGSFWEPPSGDPQKKSHFKPSRFTDFAAAVLVDDMLRSWGISGWSSWQDYEPLLKKSLAPWQIENIWKQDSLPKKIWTSQTTTTR